LLGKTAMKIQRRSANVLDVMERVLDRGVVIEVWAGVSLAGVHLVDVEARILVASIATYVKLADTVASTAPAIVSTRAARTPQLPSAAPAVPRDVAPRRRVARRRSPAAAAVRTWACAQGCTFQRAPRWSRAAIPCPYDKGRRCSVQTTA
jgi:hypothetical protein